MTASSEKSKVKFGSAVGWATALSWGQDGLAAASTFVLAFLLGPSDFGLVAIALAYVGVFELFAAQGIVTAIVQSPEVDDADLDAVFWYTLGCGALLTVLAAVSSPFMASFFGYAQLEPIVQVLGIGIVVRALTVVHEAKLVRDLNFKRLAVRVNAAMGISAIAGISCAFAGFGAWALVVQWLTRVTGMMIVLWGASAWSPRRRFNSPRSRALISFSWKSFPATLFDYATHHTEPIVMGKVLGEVAVGIYRLASRVVDLIITVVMRALWKVSFPYLAESRGDPDELRARTATCLRYSLYFSLPIVCLLALESPMLIDLFGDKWGPGVPVVRILCVYAVIRSLIMFNGPLLLAFGRPRTFSAVVGVQCAAVIGSVVVAALVRGSAPIESQLSGIAWARVAAYAAISLPIMLYIVLHVVKAPVGELVLVALPGIVVAAAAIAVDAMLIAATSALGMSPVAAFSTRVLITGAATLGLFAAADRTVRTAVISWLRPVATAPAGAVEE